MILKGDIMDNIKNYKCPACSSTLIFNTETQNLFCESCQNEYTLDSITEIENAEKEEGKSYFTTELFAIRIKEILNILECEED